MAGVVLVNPHSGPDETSPADIAAAFPGSPIREIDGKAVRPQVEDAVRDQPEFLAVAGGDGTIRCAAAVVAGTPIALLPVPAGTRNHFAKEVGIATLEEAGRARVGIRRQVDLGEVNGEVFVNNAGVGVYPRMVRQRKAEEKRSSRLRATVAAVWAQVRRLHRFTVTVDGTPHRAWMVFVGNGRYGRSLLDLTERESVDDGLLDVRILRADGRFARAKVILALVLGRIEQSPMAVFHETREIELALDRPRVDVALDGELVSLASPLRFRCRPRALTVLVPSTSD